MIDKERNAQVYDMIMEGMRYCEIAKKLKLNYSLVTIAGRKIKKNNLTKEEFINTYDRKIMQTPEEKRQVMLKAQKEPKFKIGDILFNKYIIIEVIQKDAQIRYLCANKEHGYKTMFFEVDIINKLNKIAKGR